MTDGYERPRRQPTAAQLGVEARLSAVDASVERIERSCAELASRLLVVEGAARSLAGRAERIADQILDIKGTLHDRGQSYERLDTALRRVEIQLAGMGLAKDSGGGGKIDVGSLLGNWKVWAVFFVWTLLLASGKDIDWNAVFKLLGSP